MPFKSLALSASLSEIHPRHGRSAPKQRFPALHSAIATVGLLLILASPAFPGNPMAPRDVLILMAGQHALPAYEVI